MKEYLLRDYFNKSFVKGNTRGKSVLARVKSEQNILLLQWLYTKQN